MSKLRPVLTALFIAASAILLAQENARVKFDVVSIKKNTQPITVPTAMPVQRPDGGFTMQRVPIGTLVSRAYPPAVPIDMVGLPEWAIRDHYDVSATSSLSSATPDQEQAMLRAMLADRCKLAAHFEKREQPVYDLVVARSDGKLGPNLRPSEVDCEAKGESDAVVPIAHGVCQDRASVRTPGAPRHEVSFNRRTAGVGCTVVSTPSRFPSSTSLGRCAATNRQLSTLRATLTRTLSTALFCIRIPTPLAQHKHVWAPHLSVRALQR